MEIVKKHACRTGSIIYIKDSQKWRARIMVNGKNHHVGMYSTEREAREKLADILFDIANGQYTDIAKLKEIKKAEAQKARTDRLNEKIQAYLDNSPMNKAKKKLAEKLEKLETLRAQYPKPNKDQWKRIANAKKACDLAQIEYEEFLVYL